MSLQNLVFINSLICASLCFPLSKCSSSLVPVSAYLYGFVLTLYLFTLNMDLKDDQCSDPGHDPASVILANEIKQKRGRSNSCIYWLRLTFCYKLKRVTVLSCWFCIVVLIISICYYFVVLIGSTRLLSGKHKVCY